MGRMLMVHICSVCTHPSPDRSVHWVSCTCIGMLITIQMRSVQDLQERGVVVHSPNSFWTRLSTESLLGSGDIV